MSNLVQDQYEAYPYPERDPRDEKKRLIIGSPSHPLEMDHFLWGGRRDWTQPLNILVAGGGTGDATIQMAQILTSAKRPFHITYVDLSKASRTIAEKRAKIRGLKNITFLTGSLLDAAEYGSFDYIDCCGVLHHLPDPQAGFDALAAALKDDGGMGLMVYAPFGRAGVYPLQEAFQSLYGKLPPKQKLKRAKAVFEKLSSGHAFKANTHLGDHNRSDAGFYDLLLHSQDRAFSIDQLLDSLSVAGLRLTGLPSEHLYDLERFDSGVDVPLNERLALAEKLDGTIRTHILYGAKVGSSLQSHKQLQDDDIPHFRGLTSAKFAQAIAERGQVNLTLNGERYPLNIPREFASALARVDGKTPLGRMFQGVPGLNEAWPKLSKQLTSFGLLNYSWLQKV